MQEPFVMTRGEEGVENFQKSNDVNKLWSSLNYRGIVLKMHLCANATQKIRFIELLDNCRSIFETEWYLIFKRSQLTHLEP